MGLCVLPVSACFAYLSKVYDIALASLSGSVNRLLGSFRVFCDEQRHLLLIGGMTTTDHLNIKRMKLKHVQKIRMIIMIIIIVPLTLMHCILSYYLKSKCDLCFGSIFVRV